MVNNRLPGSTEGHWRRKNITQTKTVPSVTVNLVPPKPTIVSTVTRHEEEEWIKDSVAAAAAARVRDRTEFETALLNQLNLLRQREGILKTILVHYD
jgi:hypothetical protein